jgi:DNA-directed RNA polymerase subunit M/transcription elongation factor TFIIS
MTGTAKRSENPLFSPLKCQGNIAYGVMEFCDDCHALLLLEVAAEAGKLQKRCSRCGLAQAVTETRELEVASGRVARRGAAPGAVQERTEALCERCGHSQAFFVQLQTRGADEPSTQFFTCCKCAHKCGASPRGVHCLTRRRKQVEDRIASLAPLRQLTARLARRPETDESAAWTAPDAPRQRRTSQTQ